MKYRRYKIIHFYEITDTQFGKAWMILAKTAGLDPNCDAGFPETDLYGKGEFSELFIVPYDNEVMDEIEGIAQNGEMWSPDTDEWTLDEKNQIVDGVHLITHHYCGKKQEKSIKSVESNFHIVSWMPLFQLILAEHSPLRQEKDKETGEEYFVVGSVKGHISHLARKFIGYENQSVGDFKVALVSIQGAKAEPWLLVANNPQTKLIETPEQRTADRLLEIGQWRQALPWTTKMMEQCLAKMHEHLIDTYDMYDKHKDDDPEVDDTAGIWYNNFLNANCGYYLPAIKNLLRLFDMAINDIDTCNAALNYENELMEIKQIVDKMVSDAEK